MSLFSRVRRKIKQRGIERKQEKSERKEIEKEAKLEARKEYLSTFRTKKIESMKTQARAKAEHDAAHRGGSLDAVGGFAKGAMSGLGKAGKNFLESEQFALPKKVPDFGFGGAFTPDKKRKGKKRKNKAQDILDSLI